MSELSRDIQALTGDLTRLQTEIEHFRTELRAVFDRFLNEQPGKAEGTGPLPGCSRAPHSGEKCPPKEFGAVEEDAST